MINSKVITKALKYSIVTTYVNFNPNKFYPRTVIVNNKLALHLKGNVYTKKL